MRKIHGNSSTFRCRFSSLRFLLLLVPNSSPLPTIFACKKEFLVNSSLICLTDREIRRSMLICSRLASVFFTTAAVARSFPTCLWFSHPPLHNMYNQLIRGNYEHRTVSCRPRHRFISPESCASDKSEVVGLSVILLGNRFAWYIKVSILSIPFVILWTANFDMVKGVTEVSYIMNFSHPINSYQRTIAFRVFPQWTMDI